MTRIFILWDNSLSVGNKIVDEQHMKLIDIINALYESFVDQTASIKLGKIIEELIDYADYHFKTEEELLEKYDYPFKNDHLALHEEFVIKINDFRNKYHEGKSNLTFQIMNFLRNWLLIHIKEEDQKFAVYIKNN
jgi:hemerythrin-like metal-binding protein